MAWLRITITTQAESVDALTGLLEKFDAVSVSYNPISEEALFDEPSENPGLWQRTAVSALLDPGLDMDILIACMRNLIGTENILDYGVELLQESDWKERYKEDYGVLRFSDRLCISPAWLPPPESCEYVVLMEPGLAFGTGTHPTTSLCLDWLAQHDLRGKCVIDYGCGSGILALAAATLGAGRVYAVDIDPQALAATDSNAKRNRMQERIVIQSPREELPVADILIANILMNPLLELAPRFSTLVGPGGDVVLSGLLAQQAEACLGVYRDWFKMSAAEFQDEWARLHGRRTDAQTKHPVPDQHVH